ncbi:MAG: hypothetical protein ACKVP2_09465 [Burkholderiales bacterium]
MSRKMFKTGLALLAMVQGTNGLAAVLFAENFEGYSLFPTLVNTYSVPSGGLPFAGSVQERINEGIPVSTEGAAQTWYGGRFEDPTSGNSSNSSINADLAVQNFGSINRPDDPNANYTHVGRFEDDAGLVFKVGTTGFQDVHLTFGWRTFNVESSDVVRVGYRLSNPGFGSCGPGTGGAGGATAGCFADLRTGTGAWGSWTPFTLSDTVTGTSPSGNSNSWVLENFLLPSNQAEVWVAFWLDNGEGDIGKIDNVFVNAAPIASVPLPGAIWLLGSALAFWVPAARRRYARLS